MSDLSELYQEVILDHYRRPRNAGVMEDADLSAEGYNPLCGDRLTVYLKLNGDVIESVSFQGSGCAISQASTSVMTTVLKGKTQAELESIFQAFQKMVTASEDGETDLAALGELAAISGVREFPSRVKCATLGWHTVRAALDQRGEPVSTE